MVKKDGTQPLSTDDLPKVITGNVHKEHKTILCSSCNGLGFYEKEELTDYHKREYSTFRGKCSKCNGDGRMIAVKVWWTVQLPSEYYQEMPYGDFHEFVEPHHYEDRWFRMKLDLRDRNLEEKYPKLAKVTYDKYDELIGEYRLLSEIEGKKHDI